MALERPPTLTTDANPVMDQKAIGGFTGASTTANKLSSWVPALRSADSDLLPGKDMIDARAVDMVNNDAYIQNGVRTQLDSIIGSRFRLLARPKADALGLDKVWQREFRTYVEDRFEAWANSPENYVDATRRNNFTEMCRLATCVGITVGEILAVAEWDKNKNSYEPYYTNIRLVDSARLSDPDDRPSTDRLMRKGILLNKRGIAVRYFIRGAMRNDYLPGVMDEKYYWQEFNSRTSFGRKIIIHHYEQRRIDQSRGISELVTVLKESKMLSTYQELVLQNAALNASIAATIESELPPAEAYQSLTGQNPSTADLAMNFMDQVSSYSGSAKNLTIDGVIVPHLWPNTKLRLQNAGQPGGVGTSYEESMLRKIAAAFDLSYEELSRDFTKTNYSSARAAMGQSYKSAQTKKQLFANRFATDVYRLWFEEELNSGEMFRAGVLPRNAPNYYEGLNREFYTNCEFLGAARGQIDELKETNSAIARINNSLSTHEIECARLGHDYREVFRQKAAEKELAEELGIQILAPTGGTNSSAGTVDAGGNAENESPKNVTTRGGKSDTSDDETDTDEETTDNGDE